VLLSYPHPPHRWTRATRLRGPNLLSSQPAAVGEEVAGGSAARGPPAGSMWELEFEDLGFTFSDIELTSIVLGPHWKRFELLRLGATA